MNDTSVLPEHLRLKLIGAVLQIMGCCGVTEAAIRDSFEQAMYTQKGTSPTTANQAMDSLYIRSQNLPAQLLRVWHRDDKFIDHEARPRPLPLTRGRDNLHSVIKRIDPSADATSILRSMRAVGLIRRTSAGKYLPTSESAIIDQLHPLLLEHVTKLINRLVTTVYRNAAPTGKTLSLIERHAYVSDLSSEERVAFAEFTRSHGMAYLESIDDWLQRKRTNKRTAKRSKKPKTGGVAAGVYLFAYLGDDEIVGPSG